MHTRTHCGTHARTHALCTLMKSYLDVPVRFLGRSWPPPGSDGGAAASIVTPALQDRAPGSVHCGSQCPAHRCCTSGWCAGGCLCSGTTQPGRARCRPWRADMRHACAARPRACVCPATQAGADTVCAGCAWCVVCAPLEAVAGVAACCPHHTHTLAHQLTSPLMAAFARRHSPTTPGDV
jgi:hypothetical protein